MKSIISTCIAPNFELKQSRVKFISDVGPRKSTQIHGIDGVHRSSGTVTDYVVSGHCCLL